MQRGLDSPFSDWVRFQFLSPYQCTLMKAWIQSWSLSQYFIALLLIPSGGELFWGCSINANHQKYRLDPFGRWPLFWVERSGLAWLWLIIVRANSPKVAENLIYLFYSISIFIVLFIKIGDIYPMAVLSMSLGGNTLLRYSDFFPFRMT